MIANMIVVTIVTIAQSNIVEAKGDTAAFTIHPTYFHEGNKSWIIQQAKPQSSIKDYLTVENLSDEDQKIRLELREASNEKGDFKPIEKATFKNIGKWIHLSNAEYILKPYEKKKIPFEINIPASAEKKEYTAVIYGIGEKVNAQNIRIVTRIGVRLYIQVDTIQFGEASILTSPTYKSGFFAILSGIGLFASLIYYLMERKKIAPIIVLLLFSLNFSPVFAQVMEIEVLGGGYRLRGPNLIPFDNVQASFQSAESTKDIRDINPQNEESIENDQALDYIAIEDQNGGNPFQVTVRASDFIAGDNRLDNTHFFIKNANGDADTADDIIPDNNQTIETGVMLDSTTDSFADLSTDRTLFRNDEGRAPGAWRIFPVFKIVIPSGTPPGTYSSTITFTII